MFVLLRNLAFCIEQYISKMFSGLCIYLLPNFHLHICFDCRFDIKCILSLHFLARGNTSLQLLQTVTQNDIFLHHNTVDNVYCMVGNSNE